MPDTHDSLATPAPLAPLARALREGTRDDLLRYVEDTLARIEEVEPQLRSLLPEDGRAERLHQAVEDLVARFREPASRPPLFGVLVGIKDIIAVDGLPTRAGSALPAEAFEMPEAAVVRRLRDAGAIVAGKTVTAEFASMSPGGTANPNDTRHTPGGSSSGSTAGVAAGCFPLAVGTQTGGSVIRPAAFCGVVGFKPSYDRIPTAGVLYHAPSVDTLGIFTQDMEGISLAAPVVLDGWREVSAREAGEVVLGVPEGAYLDLAEPEGRAAFEDAATRLAERGVTVRRVPFLDDVDAVGTRHSRLMEAEFAATHEERFARWGPMFSGGAAEQVDRGRRVTDAQLREGVEGRLELCERVAALLDEHGLDAIVCPAAPGPAPEGLRTTGSPRMNAPWTHAGVPAITLPSGFVGRLPVGLQLVGRFAADEELVAVAAALAPLLERASAPA